MNGEFPVSYFVSPDVGWGLFRPSVSTREVDLDVDGPEGWEGVSEGQRRNLVRVTRRNRGPCLRGGHRDPRRQVPESVGDLGWPTGLPVPQSLTSGRDHFASYGKSSETHLVSMSVFYFTRFFGLTNRGFNVFKRMYTLNKL